VYNTSAVGATQVLVMLKILSVLVFFTRLFALLCPGRANAAV
jgi:hypothetical protein